MEHVGSGNSHPLLAMTRPAAASFAEFFPAAPRAARDRAMERERAKVKAQESASAHSADTNGHRTPLNPSASSQHADGPVARSSSSSRSHVNGSRPHAAYPPTDDTESLARDTRIANKGSASSHTSTSSSVSSAPTGLSASARMRMSNTQLTPPTTIASPSYLSTAAPVKAQSTTPRRADGTDRLLPIPNASVHDTTVVERVPARDPSRSIKCIKLTYEPVLDKSLSSSDRKKAKPIYKEFGLVCAPDNLTLRGGRHLDGNRWANAVWTEQPR